MLWQQAKGHQQLLQLLRVGLGEGRNKLGKLVLRNLQGSSMTDSEDQGMEAFNR
jgi:hypothetical protein